MFAICIFRLFIIKRHTTFNSDLSQFRVCVFMCVYVCANVDVKTDVTLLCYYLENFIRKGLNEGFISVSLVALPIHLVRNNN